MKAIVQNEKYGEIVYQESFLTGKNKIFVNGQELAQTYKNEYLYMKDDKRVNVTVKGSYLFGTALYFNADEIQITPKVKWYEALIAILILGFVIVWGNVPTLCAIIPIVGGAIGGAIAGVCATISLLLMRMTKKPAFKILIGLGMFVLNFIACFLVDLVIILATVA